jgi:hypothetical protein
MSRLRFSIASLLGLVLFLGVALAAIRQATGLWDSAVFTTTFGLLLVSVLLAVHCKEHRRAFWLGFALFGWVALMASLVPPVESRLITTKLLAYLDSELMGRDTRTRLTLYLREIAMAQDALAERLATPADSGGASQVPITLKANVWARRLIGGGSGTSENFMRIGHSLIALVLAWVGGHLSRYLYVRNQRVQSRDPIVPSHARIA